MGYWASDKTLVPVCVLVSAMVFPPAMTLEKYHLLGPVHVLWFSLEVLRYGYPYV